MTKHWSALPIVDRTLVLCLSHLPPLFSLPEYVVILKTGDFEHRNWSISVSGFINQRFPGLPVPAYHPDYAYPLLAELLSAKFDDIDKVCMFFHRKYVSPEQQGVAAKGYHEARMELSRNIKLYNTLPKVFEKTILLPRAVNVGTIINQYSYCHHIEDFVFLAGLVQRLGILSHRERLEFEASKYLLPAGGLVGLLPVDVFLQVVGSLQIIIGYILYNGFEPVAPSHPYQARALSFFLERLSSFMVLRLLKERYSRLIEDSNNSIFGWLVHACPGEVLSPEYTGGSIPGMS